MIYKSIAALVASSLALSVSPTVAKADLKDALIGGAVGAAAGAIINQSINDKKQRDAAAQNQKKVVVQSGANLNSQYSRAERIEIQSALTNLGYDVGVIDGVLGSRSRAGIAQFQSSLGEPATGQLTVGQYVALTNPSAAYGTASQAFYDRPLQPNELFLLQQSLTILGYYNGSLDGVDSPLVQNASAQFVASQGLNPQSTTQVQATVLAAGAAGVPAPVALQQEANAQFAAANPTPQYGGGTQQVGYGSQQPYQQQQQFQQQQNLFGAPQQPAVQQQQFQQQQFQQQPVNNGGVFAAPQQQPVTGVGTVPQQQQNLFAPQQQQQQPQQQQQFQQQGGTNTLFASGNAAAPQQQTLQQQPASSLDVYTLQQQPAANTQLATQPQPSTTFGTTAPAAAFAATGEQQ